MNRFLLGIFVVINLCLIRPHSCSSRQISTWQGSLWNSFPTSSASWSLETRIPMSSSDYTALDENVEEARGKFRLKRKLKKLLLPLLLAYKLKFFTLIPVLIGGLLLLTGATGLAGFFFALFAAVMGLKTGHY
nr:uncharacterized protein LOC111427644 [Onthophagus taurus]